MVSEMAGLTKHIKERNGRNAGNYTSNHSSNH